MNSWRRAVCGLKSIILVVVVLTTVFSCIEMIYNYRMLRNVFGYDIQWMIQHWMSDLSVAGVLL